MSMLANWICYASQGDPQHYAATSRMSSALSGETTALFIRHAEETLPHVPRVALPLWQYVCSGDQGPAVLTRATMRTEVSGATAAVIWGLVLPPQHVASARFSLQPCVGVFPPDDSTAPWPQPLDLSSLPAGPPASRSAEQLAAVYAETSKLRLPLPAEEAPVTFLCQLLELLPPLERSSISFATAPVRLRRIEIDPDLQRAPQPAPAVLARLRLWDRLRRVLEAADVPASLRHDPLGWLAPLLQQPDPPGRVIALLRLLALEEVSAEMWQTIMSWLRRALEESLTERADARETSNTLDELCRAGLLARPEIFPPLWPARVALKLQVLGSLAPQTLAQILRPDAAQLLQLLLTGLRRGPTAAKTVDVVAGLARAPAHVNRQLLAAASQETLTQLCAQPERLQSDAGLATAVAVLAMYFHGKREPAATRDS